ncbi:di-trans,poly-cis-decaprenylcistransferase [bacterium]|nr:di-trans,poly-cis-decaprenylcistransferase [bacterium]
MTADSAIPRHVAVIMDGNGRWAQQRGQPRGAGHRAGVKATREIVENCARAGVGYLTLFAFSSENWQRPASEVGLLMDLFMRALGKEVADLDKNKVRVRFVGDHTAFSDALQREMRKAEVTTASNDGLQLYIAVGYGGHADITQAVRALAEQVEAGALKASHIDEAAIAGRLLMAGVPPPDLFIRTGGEQRISNFLLWDLAYSELYFCDTLWPDFDKVGLDAALRWYAGRQRRFGRVLDEAS